MEFCRLQVVHHCRTAEEVPCFQAWQVDRQCSPEGRLVRPWRQEYEAIHPALREHRKMRLTRQTLVWRIMVPNGEEHM